jgi:hypothetical protein
MRFAQYACYVRTEAERVRHSLKDNIAIVRTISVPTQGCEGKRMSGIIRKRKSALRRQGLVASVCHCGAPGSQQSVEFGLRAGL